MALLSSVVMSFHKSAASFKKSLNMIFLNALRALTSLLRRQKVPLRVQNVHDRASLPYLALGLLCLNFQCIRSITIFYLFHICIRILDLRGQYPYFGRVCLSEKIHINQGLY
jgi:hypothetical protein